MLGLPEGATAEILEYKGSGLETLTGELDRLERQMAALGARVLSAPMVQAETAETTRIKAAGDSALLSMQADILDSGLTSALRTAEEWTGADASDVAFTLGRDFVSGQLLAPEIAALTDAYQARLISYESLIWNLKEGERLPPDVTAEVERLRARDLLTPRTLETS